MSQGLHKLGAQLEGALGNRDKWLVPERVYHIPIRWDEIELTQGVATIPAWPYETITGLDNKLGHDNYQLAIGLKTTPPFFSLPPKARNSPPKPEHYIDFARFAETICMAFHPYAIEIYNEPEFSVAESAKWPEFFGGWGDMGAEYGQLVRETWDYLHTREIDTKVIAGASFGLVNVDRALQFLTDAVNAGMQADFWSFHAYWKYSDVIYGNRDYYQALWFADQAYDIFPAPQIISETSVMRDTFRPELPAHRKAQADLLQFYLKYMPSTPIESVWWYTLADNGWEHTDMVDKQVIYPVYKVWAE